MDGTYASNMCTLSISNDCIEAANPALSTRFVHNYYNYNCNFVLAFMYSLRAYSPAGFFAP